MNEVQTVICCEGFYDRAFWHGLLLRVGCEAMGGPGQPPPDDPWGKAVVGGHFAFKSAKDEFVRLVPCRGKRNVWREAILYIKTRKTEAIARLVVNMDDDGTRENPRTSRASEHLSRIIPFEPEAIALNEDTIVMDNGALPIHLIDWRTTRDTREGAPAQQTLERVVCEAIVTAHPERGPAVDNWLASRPEPPDKPNPKEHAWSHMAGWYANRGCDSFFRDVWEDAGVAMQLERLLKETGVWEIAELVAGRRA